MILCVVCGKEMPGAKACKKYCSYECTYAAKKERGTGKTGAQIHKRLCAYCGEEFLSINNGKKKYCSSLCRKKSFPSVEKNKTEFKSLRLEDKRNEAVEKSRKINNNKEIIRIDALAKAAGMSYGKYVSMLSLREGGV